LPHRDGGLASRWPRVGALQRQDAGARPGDRRRPGKVDRQDPAVRAHGSRRVARHRCCPSRPGRDADRIRSARGCGNNRGRRPRRVRGRARRTVRRRLLLVRHGVTDWNREGRFQGYQDPPLSTDGLNEARMLAQRLADAPDERPARIVTSPLFRASQTAAAIADALPGDPVAVEADSRLIELGQGEWEGRTHDELEVNDAKRYAAWRHSSPRRPPPGGESLEDASERVGSALDEILAAGDGGAWPACVVAHGGSLRI